jgi:hypothetical protein
VREIEDEADLLEERGYPQLRQSLLETYRNNPLNRHPRDSGNDNSDATWNSPVDGARSMDLLQSRPGASDQAIPREWARDRPDFVKLVRKARAAQNDLSLVFHDPVQASLVVFGDAPRWIVQLVSSELSTRPYQVSLAPHHGSRKVPSSIPEAETCISQHGPRLGPNWHYHKKSHQNTGKCLSVRYDATARHPIRLGLFTPYLMSAVGPRIGGDP